jgi:hypothetical protein
MNYIEYICFQQFHCCVWICCHRNLFVLQSLPSNRSTCYIVPSLRLFVLSSLPANHHFSLSEVCTCDICDWSRLPALGLGAHGNYSPTAPDVPSLRPLIPSSSLKGARRSRFITIFFLQSVWVKISRVVSASILMAPPFWGYWHCGQSWPIVPSSGDSEDDCGEADEM